MAAQTQSEIALRAVQADITTLAVHAIVNAANETLLGGGGVDGAIHNVAGPGLLRECRALGGCPTGEARITGGHGLPSGFVIHTVGPVWKGGGAHEAELLRACYLNSLALAEQHQLAIVAFPSISTGVYGYPKEPAARIAIASVREFSTRAQFVAEVIFCCFAEADLVIYRRLLAAEAA